MKLRIALIVAVVSVVLVVGVGAVLTAAPVWSDEAGWGWHDEMHASEEMRAVHEQMPAQQQAECDRMHAQMRATDRHMDTMMGADAHPMSGSMHRSR